MSWARLDDKFHQNTKIMELSDGAFRLYVCAITLACAEQRRGNLSHSQAQALTRMQRIPLNRIKELVDAGCWDVTDSGYAIHDFNKFNPEYLLSNERVKRFREKRRQALLGASDETVTETADVTVSSVSKGPEGNVTVTRRVTEGETSPIPSQPNYVSPNPLALRNAKRPPWDFLDVLVDSEQLVRVRRADGSIWAYEMDRWLEEASGARLA